MLFGVALISNDRRVVCVFEYSSDIMFITLAVCSCVGVICVFLTKISVIFQFTLIYEKTPVCCRQKISDLYQIDF